MFSDDLLADVPPRPQEKKSDPLHDSVEHLENLEFEHLDTTDRSPGVTPSVESPATGKASPPPAVAPSSNDFKILDTTNDFLSELTSSTTVGATANLLDDSLSDFTGGGGGHDLLSSEPDDMFSFNKPLPPEPAAALALADFLRSEAEASSRPQAASAAAADSPRSDSPPPPIPRHQSQDDSGDEFEPSHTPEPDYEPPTGGSTSPPPVRESTPPRDPSPPPPAVVRRPSPPRPAVAAASSPSPPQPTVAATAVEIGAKDLFRKLGLDAWFDPGRLHPKVESLIYWRDVKKSGVVFGVAMVSLLSLVYCSLITVVSYLCLLILMCTIAFRIYKAFMQAVQKTTDGHPFKHLLEVDIEVSESRVKQIAEMGVKYLNESILELRRLFLVVDLLDSLKFALCLWAMTYVGALFNGLTLIIFGVIALFTLPKVYENNQQQIDTYIELASGKLADITNKIKVALPVGKKEPEKKDQ